MNQFGLGLVLNFTDNASSGMANAANQLYNLQSAADNVNNSLMGMYAASQSMTQIGSLFESQGKSIIRTLYGVTNSVLETGQEFFNYRMQLRALYGEEGYEEEFNRLTQYAKKSVFTLKDLMSSVTMLKAVGIEAMDDLSSSTGNTTQKLMDYASDIAAMIPGLRTAGGTGVRGAMYAIKEYVAEGNALTLKRGASLDILGILGEAKGSTAEERARQVADLVEKLGIAGYTNNLFEGSPVAQMSNLTDYWDLFKLSIADNGAFEAYYELIGNLVSVVTEFTEDEGRMARVSRILAEAIRTLIEPLNKVVVFLRDNADSIMDWIDNNEELFKVLVKSAAGFGILSLAAGKLLKLSGGVLSLVASFTYLGGRGFFSPKHMGLVSRFLIKSFRQMSQITYKGRDVLYGLHTVAQTLFPSIRTNLEFTNIETNTLTRTATGLFSFLTSSWATFLPLVLLGLGYIASDTENIGEKARGVLEYVTNFFKILFDVWDNDFSKETYDLMEQMGLTDFFGLLVRTKELVGDFFSGFREGLKNFFSDVDLGPFEKILEGIVPLLISLTGGKGEDNTFAQMKEDVAGLGQALGENIPKVLAAIVVISLLTKAFRILYVVLYTLNTIRTVISTFFTVLGLGPSLVIVGILALIVACVFFRDKILNVLNSIDEYLQNVFAKDWTEVFGPLLGGALNLFFDEVKTLWDSVKLILEGIVKFIHGVFTLNLREALDGVLSIFQGVFNPIISLIDKVTGALGNLIGKFRDTDIEQRNFERNSTRVSGSQAHAAKNTITVRGHAKGTNFFEGGITAINEEGGELVTLPRGTTIMPHDTSLEESMRRGIALGASEAFSVFNSTAPQPSSGDNYNISFGANAIVVKCDSTSTKDLENISERIYNIIKRKLEVEKMSRRNAGVYT